MPIGIGPSGKNFGSNGYTIDNGGGGLDTTGMNLLVWTHADNGGAAPTMTDSKGNTFVLQQRYVPVAVSESLYYCINPTVGTGHTFTCAKTGGSNSGQVRSYSAANGGFDVSAIDLAFGSATLLPGPVTPTTNDQLIVTAMNFDVAASVPTINGGFTNVLGDVGSGGTYLGSCSADLIQTTAAAADPTWTHPSTNNLYGIIATFKANAGPSQGSASGSFFFAGVAGPPAKQNRFSNPAVDLEVEDGGVIGGTAIPMVIGNVSSGAALKFSVQSWFFESGISVKGGAGTGTLAWVGTSRGVTPGSAIGSISWVGSAAGVKQPSGAGTGTLSWVGTSRGVTPGSAIGSISWVGSAAGTRLNPGTAVGTLTWVGAAVGLRQPRGASTGSLSWVGGATGLTPSKGASAGTLTWVGVARGVRPGSATGTVTWTGSASGARGSAGSASRSITWVGTAIGASGSTAIPLGSASSSITWAGSAAGSRTSSGSGVASVTWISTSRGVRPGSSSGSITWAGSASGRVLRSGSASTALTLVGSAAGQSDFTVQYWGVLNRMVG